MAYKISPGEEGEERKEVLNENVFIHMRRFSGAERGREVNAESRTLSKSALTSHFLNFAAFILRLSRPIIS